MEFNQKKLSIVKNLATCPVIGFPVISVGRGRLPASQYHLTSVSDELLDFRKCKVDSVMGKMNTFGEKVESFTRGIREHVRLGAKITETVRGKLSLGAKILQLGGVDKVFQQKFDTREGEELLKASQCYLSTTAGPIAGILFISTDKITFCSERCIKLSSPTGELFRTHYKVMIPLRKIKTAIESENVKKPSRKYIQVVTADNFEFWFMGVLNHKKTLKYLHQAISQSSMS